MLTDAESAGMPHLAQACPFEAQAEWAEWNHLEWEQRCTDGMKGTARSGTYLARCLSHPR